MANRHDREQERRSWRVLALAAVALGGACAAGLHVHRAARQERAVLLQNNDYGPYPANQDPWLKVGKGSYKLWAKDYQSRHGDGTRYDSLWGTHGLAAKSEEPDRLNRKNGWEQHEFFKWVRHQGGDAPTVFQQHGMKTMGSEYIHPLKRLSINSFADLKAFNPEYDIPSFMCGEDWEDSDLISGHADCGKLKLFTEEAKAQPLWFADRKSHLSSDDIHQKMASVHSHVKNMLPNLSGERPWDDAVMYCYSQFPDGPEFSQCMSDVKDASDPVTGVGSKAPSWKKLTKGLWQRHADGSVAAGGGDDKLFGSTWQQLTDDLWDHHRNGDAGQERNGMLV